MFLPTGLLQVNLAKDAWRILQHKGRIKTADSRSHVAICEASIPLSTFEEMLPCK